MSDFLETYTTRSGSGSRILWYNFYLDIPMITPSESQKTDRFWAVTSWYTIAKILRFRFRTFQRRTFFDKTPFLLCFTFHPNIFFVLTFLPILHSKFYPIFLKFIPLDREVVRESCGIFFTSIFQG